MGGWSLAAEREKSRSLSPDCAGLELMTELKPLTRVCVFTQTVAWTLHMLVGCLFKKKKKRGQICGEILLRVKEIADG